MKVEKATRIGTDILFAAMYVAVIYAGYTDEELKGGMLFIAVFLCLAVIVFVHKVLKSVLCTLARSFDSFFAKGE